MDRVVRTLRHLLRHKDPAPPATTQPVNSTSAASPNGVPPQKGRNSDETVAGTYNQDGLSEPAIADPVTGSGGGPLIRT